MEQIRLIVEQEIEALSSYEAEYRKILRTLNDSDDEQIMKLSLLDHCIGKIRSWLGVLTAEEYLVIWECVVEGKAFAAIQSSYERSFGTLTLGSEELLYLYKEKGLIRIAKMLFDEHESGARLINDLECGG